MWVLETKPRPNDPFHQPTFFSYFKLCLDLLIKANIHCRLRTKSSVSQSLLFRTVLLYVCTLDITPSSVAMINTKENSAKHSKCSKYTLIATSVIVSLPPTLFLQSFLLPENFSTTRLA